MVRRKCIVDRRGQDSEFVVQEEDDYDRQDSQSPKLACCANLLRAKVSIADSQFIPRRFLQSVSSCCSSC